VIKFHRSAHDSAPLAKSCVDHVVVDTKSGEEKFILLTRHSPLYSTCQKESDRQKRNPKPDFESSMCLRSAFSALLDQSPERSVVQIVDMCFITLTSDQLKGEKII
jgi:hypothetical protein